MIRLQMFGLDGLIKDVQSLGDSKKYTKLQHDLVIWMKQEAKRLCPVDTGHMRSTIYMRNLGKYKYELGVTCHYAVWNEFGHMPGNIAVGDEENPIHYKGGYRPFMRPAVWKGMKRLPKLFEKIYDTK